jgi:hypothetical protein
LEHLEEIRAENARLRHAVEDVGARMQAQEAESRRVQRATAASAEQLQRNQLGIDDHAALVRTSRPP